MRRKYKIGSLFSMMFLAVILFGDINVYATGSHSNAVSDIMTDSRFQGAISSIEWLTTRVDYWFTMVITATAFFIISAALLKNVCAGAYVANHKFWDKVAEAHEKSEALSLAGIRDYFTGKQFMQTSAGGLKDAILGIIPNIKALTDFDDADIEPKAYFMRAIPQMVACIIIGVFIYNGYYRDTAATVGMFGSEICNRVFASVDPATFVDKLTQTTKAPDNIFANDETLQGSDAHAISKAIYKVLISNSKGLTEEPAKEAVMRDSENIAYQMVKNANWESTFYGTTRKYDFSAGSIKVNLVSQVPNGFSGDFSHPTVTQVGDNVDDKFTVSVYGDIPSTCSSYVPDEYHYVYISLIMSGSSKDVSKPGTTSLTAAAGNWDAATVETLNLTCTDKKLNSKEGETSLWDANVTLSSVVTPASVTSIVQKYCEGNGLTLNTSSITIGTFEGHLGGVARFHKAPVGATLSAAVDVEFKATVANSTEAAGSAENPPKTFRVEIPIVITLK